MTSRNGKCTYVGTSGWHYEHWRGPFYPPEVPARRWLQHYAGVFRLVEVNNSFYRLPDAATLRAWKDGTPDHFRFCIKASRYVTHMKKLDLDAAGLERFFSRIEILGDRLGPILFQLPPNWAPNVPRLASFLAELPAQHRYAFELRDPRWDEPAVRDLLEKHRAAYCIYELGGALSPHRRTTDFVYVRLHGPGKKYEGSYDRATLARWARRFERWNGEGRDVYVFFDNDQLGYAAANAKELQERLAKRRNRPS